MTIDRAERGLIKTCIWFVSTLPAGIARYLPDAVFDHFSINNRSGFHDPVADPDPASHSCMARALRVNGWLGLDQLRAGCSPDRQDNKPENQAQTEAPFAIPCVTDRRANVYIG